MALELSHKRSGTRGARRIARKQIAEAVQALGNGIPSDEAVHTARKELKKARATLRLLRSALGKKRYRAENRRLRDIARPLSELRDSKVLLDTVDKLAEQSPHGNGAASLGELRRDLERSRAAVSRKLLSGPEPLEAQRELLRTACKRASGWPVGKHGWSVLGRGLERVYRAGREALAAAEADPCAENLHEWRKQTKYLWHELQLLAPLHPDRIDRLARQTHRLSEYLGDDHDLSVLRAKLAGERGGNSEELRHVIERRGEELREKAFTLGKRLYQESPDAFHSRMAKYWRQWRRSA